MNTTDATVIRVATAQDCAGIEAIAMAAYAVYLDRMSTKPFPMLDDYAVHIRHERVYILENAEGICGYVVLIAQDANTLLLDNIAVHPACQGAGYGHCLAQFAAEWGRARGYGRICLYTNEVMTENASWYARLGYGVTHKAVENGYRRIYMAKAL